ncbi:MAG: teicoplanin resistance protein VanZ [Allosphingosinicella sp.]|uniref:teicoplanin resistance protein VanZ n=1 Tax=Allosphingosinicella sp. TaxID=2823234 RepID=UPI00393D6220
MPIHLWRVLFWTAFTAAFALALHPAPPPVFPPTSDKIQHFAAFAGLTMLALLAYPKTPLWRIGVGLAAAGAAIEFAQLIPGLNRHGDFADWIADIAGILIVLIPAGLLRRRRRFRESPKL